jgi:serine/threonine protein kinase
MRLWNDYEGKTIAGLFPVEKLIRPEGRSAFFTTSNGSGKPAVLRLIESINDEDEILDRWKAVADLNQAHLITFKKYGQTVLDGTPLIYAVMEPTEADLASILHERPLTLDETRQIATSLVPALHALHASGLIHEHIEPSNVLATSDLVKLRSDCIREAPSDPAEANALRARDIRDLAIVLLQALTQSRTLPTNGHTPLPYPFDQIIRNGISGTWTLDQIAAALNPPAVATPQPHTPDTKPDTTPDKPQYAAPPRKPQAKPYNPAQATLPLEGLSQPDNSPAAVAATMPAPTPAPEPRTVSAALDRIKLSLDADPRRKRLWIASAAAAIVIIAALGWHSLQATPDHPITPISDMSPATTAAVEKPATGSATKPSASSPSGSPTAQPNDQTLSTPDGHPQWRVVAFTYNHEDQAWQKAAALSREHSFLHPEVFSPTGHAPYLVTVGGAMTREQATAFKEKARRAGLPRDIYAQNYTGKSR